MKYKKITRPVKHKFVMTSEELDHLIGLFDKYQTLKRATLPDSDSTLTVSEEALRNTFNRAYNGGF